MLNDIKCRFVCGRAHQRLARIAILPHYLVDTAQVGRVVSLHAAAQKRTRLLGSHVQFGRHHLSSRWGETLHYHFPVVLVDYENAVKLALQGGAGLGLGGGIARRKCTQKEEEEATHVSKRGLLQCNNAVET